jgi:signal peptidase I
MNEDNWYRKEDAPAEKAAEENISKPTAQAEAIKAEGAVATPAPEVAQQKEAAKPEKSLLTEIWSWLRDLAVAAVICLLLIIYIAQPFRVEKTSMEPLLHDGDRILVSKISLMLEPIKRGDIVVLNNPRKPEESWIKRVIGLPGEEVRIEDGEVYINGKRLAETYIPEEKRLGPKNTFPPESVAELTRRYEHLMERFGMVIEDNPGHGDFSKVAQRVPEGYYFVMGDNRIYSMDSRDSVYTINDPDHPEEGGPGLIPKGYIYGKAIFRYWPLDKFGPIPSVEYKSKKNSGR